MPNSWALVGVAALHAAERFSPGPKMLEFGHGVGSTGLLFARHGFDVIVSLDVMEHLNDPLAAISQITSWLAPGGVLILNVAFGLDPAQPEHLVRRRLGMLDAIRGIGLQRASLDNLLVFYKQKAPGPGPLVRAVDVILAAWEDARNSNFRPLAAIARRLRAHEAPGLLPPPAPGNREID